MRRSMPDGTEDDLVTILTVKGVTKAEKAECLEEFRQSEWSVCSSHNLPFALKQTGNRSSSSLKSCMEIGTGAASSFTTSTGLSTGFSTGFSFFISSSSSFFFSTCWSYTSCSRPSFLFYPSPPHPAATFSSFHFSSSSRASSSSLLVIITSIARTRSSSAFSLDLPLTPHALAHWYDAAIAAWSTDATVCKDFHRDSYA